MPSLVHGRHPPSTEAGPESQKGQRSSAQRPDGYDVHAVRQVTFPGLVWTTSLYGMAMPQQMRIQPIMKNTSPQLYTNTLLYGLASPFCMV